ncbi:MAG TPA: hypothetical protein VFJ43_06825 [Bacteroidia bacterium]|nr:hypothetical protein [Bacteroidia bacterium]
MDKRPIPDDFIQETYEELETLFTADDSINNLPGNDIEEIPF